VVLIGLSKKALMRAKEKAYSEKLSPTPSP